MPVAQDRALQVDVVVATPLRLCRLLKLRKLPLSTAHFLVLDEADKLLQQKADAPTHLKQIDSIVAACQHKNKNLVGPFKLLWHLLCLASGNGDGCLLCKREILSLKRHPPAVGH